jgi:ketosteroid isomerase-like protein
MFAKVGGQGSFTPLKEEPNVMNISSLAAGCSLSAALLMGCVASVQERAPCHEAAAQNETVVRQAFEQWAAGGSVFEILSPDVVWTIRGSGPFATTYVGIDSFLEQAAAPLVERLAGPIEPVVHDVWAIDDRVIVRFDGSATTLSGDPYRNQFVWILRMEDGVVRSAEAFLDLVAYQEVIDSNEPVPTLNVPRPKEGRGQDN